MHRNSNLQIQINALTSRIETLRRETKQRKLVAIAGPPSAGKTTLARLLVNKLPQSSLVSMDGFHLDNSILIQKGLKSRKGSPETFDVDGFTHLIARLKENAEVYVPSFDRKLDKTTNCSYLVPNFHDLVIVEGNYLLLDEPKWRGLRGLWDLAVFIDLSIADVRKRSLKRWEKFHVPINEAIEWVDNNDVPNAEKILHQRMAEDVTITK